MTKLLLRLFVRNSENTKDPAVRSAIGSLSGIVGIVCNLLLFAGKITVGTLTGSMSITADAMNNLSDASSSIVTLLGFRLAQRPADEDHPYGHARFEYLSGLAVAAMIIVIGFELAKSSVEKILSPTPVEFSLTAGIILAVSIGVKLWLSLFNTNLGKRIGSTTLLAAAADSRNDVLATSVVLLCAVVQYFTRWQIDAVLGLGVALFILWSGWNLIRETVSPLLGEAASPELRELIVDYISEQPHVLGFHDLMVHDYGPGQRFASLHVEMDMREDPLYCHELIDDMERECLRSHNVHLVIHYDPVVTDDPERDRLKERCQALLQQRDERLSLHDFRMVQGRRHMNLIFDVALPSGLHSQRRDIPKEMEEALRREDSRIYHVIINYDVADFS